MRLLRKPLVVFVGLVVALSVAVAGCGGGSGGGQASGQADLSGATFTVGSKEFTEQLILGHITKLVLEDAGAKVNDQIGLAGSVAARKALTSGDIDMYWEYTGTGWITYLGNTEPISGRQEQFEKVAQQDLEKNNIKWLAPPAPANNTYAIAVRSEAYEDLGVKKLSDFGPLIQNSPEKASLCVASEFANRDDGLPGLEEEYGYQFPDNQVSELDLGVIYDAVDNGQRCNYGEVFQTDGRIAALDLKLVEDDKNFFPNYNPALTMRKEVFEENKKLKDVFEPISEKLDTETLRGLNRKVDVDGGFPEDVAEEWLTNNNLIG